MTRLKLGTSENDVKAMVLKALKALGAWSFAPIQNGMGVHGIPDRIACVPIEITQAMVGKTIGVFAAVESKRPGRRGEKLGGVKGHQVDQLYGILDAGGYASVVDCEDDMGWLVYVMGRQDLLHSPTLKNLLESRTGVKRG